MLEAKNLLQRISTMLRLVFFFVIVAIVTSEEVQEKRKILKTESDLRKALFKNYDKLVRPVKNSSDSVKVSASLAPNAVVLVDEENNRLVLDCWISMEWTDDALEWDPKDYNNIKIIRIPSSEVWKPDLSFYDSIPDAGLFPKSQTDVVIKNSKKVFWVEKHTVDVRCPMINRNDINTIVCDIKMASWAYSGLELNLVLMNDVVDMSNFKNLHPDWWLEDAVPNREEKVFNCCPEPYPSLTFKMILKKRIDRLKPKNKNSENNLI